MDQLLLRIPKIMEANFGENGWKLYFYEEYESIIMEKNGGICSEVLEEFGWFLNQNLKGFRYQATIKAVPFLAGISFEKKEIRLASIKLSRELFLLSELKGEKIDNKALSEFSKHMDGISALDISSFPTDIQRISLKHNLVDFLDEKGDPDLDKRMDLVKSELIKEIKKYKTSLFEKITDWGLTLTANYALLRIHLLKFLAILPSLDFDEEGHEVKRILIESLRRVSEDSHKARQLKKTGENGPIPYWLEKVCGIKAKVLAYIPAKILAKSIRASVRFMAKRFIAGETIEKASESLKKLFDSKRDATLDQLGELVVSEKEADHYRDEVIKLVRGFSLHVKKGETNRAGLHRANVSIKVSALCSDFNPADFDYTYSLVGPRLRDILLAAKEEDVHINVDAEHIHYRDLVFRVYEKVLLTTPELNDFKNTGIVIQAYLRDAYEHFVDVLTLAKKRDIKMPIRLVKGAYWDAETIEGQAHSFAAPQFLNKEETDLMFRHIIASILKEGKYLQLVLASHNYSDHSFAVAYRDVHYPDAPAIEHQCLDMTYEALSTAMANKGWAVRNYVPVGSLLVGMGYLVRRIMENSSQVGILTIMRSHQNDAEVLSPAEVHLKRIKNGEVERDFTTLPLSSEFLSNTPVQLYRKNELQAVLEDIKQYKDKELGRTYENYLYLNGEEKEVYSSSDQTLLVGKIKQANENDVREAIKTAYISYSKGPWAKSTPLLRASVMLEAASIMLAQRGRLAAIIMHEAGKTLSEALADVDEAIDFLNYYSRDEVSIGLQYQNIGSKGVIASITPWNFPIAIPCGMVSAPLLAGNSVILKSAGQTPVIAQCLVNIFHRAGVPKDALIHLPGPGSVVGEILVNHENVAGVVFTGSKEVGMNIAHKIQKRLVHNELYGIDFPASAITEMGGKNAIVVTANAELDETVSGIIYSAFGHAGQKCSACSRVIVDNRIKDRLIERFREAAQDIKVGSAIDLSTQINPLITEKEKNRLIKAIELATKECEEFGGKVIIDRSKEETPGHSVGPAIFELPLARAKMSESFACRELFGPVVHVIGFDTIDEAIDLFNCTEYALTGGVFSQSQDDIDFLTSKMEVGNVYVNRGNTGARVGIEPFGGFKLSGTGPKAGGKEYVKSFHMESIRKDNFAACDDQRGSDYKFRCATPCSLPVEERINRIAEAVDQIVDRFEWIFKGVYGDEKRVLQELSKWLKNDYTVLRTKGESNHVIPGQQSFNDFSLSAECNVLLTYNSIPHIKSIVQFMSALASGAGMTILARNEESFGFWKKIVEIVHSCGISKANLDLYFCTYELLVSAIRGHYISFIIVDGDDRRIREILEIVYNGSCDEKRMKAVLTPLNTPPETDFYSNAVRYLWTRSFAVNTMRHGAPLEVEL